MKNLFVKRELAFAALIFFIALLAYSPYFGIGMMEFDASNKLVFAAEKNVSGLPFLFLQPDQSAEGAGYRPVPSILWACLCMIAGMQFPVFHSLNFFVHALNSVLVFFLAKRLLNDRKGFFSLFAALAFALHSSHLSTVAFISRLPDMLMALFLVLSLLSFSFFFEKRNKRFFMLAFAFCFLGIFSKESGILIPLVLLFYCIIFSKQKRPSILPCLRTCVPFLILLILFPAMMFLSIGQLSGYGYMKSQPDSLTLFAFFDFLFYPVDLFGAKAFGSFEPAKIGPWLDTALVLFGTAFSVLGLSFLSKKRQHKVPFFLLSWILLFLFAFMVFNFLPTWYVYVPSIPFAVLLALCLKMIMEKAVKRFWEKAVSAAIALFLLSLIAFSPLFFAYSQPNAGSEMTQAFYTGLIGSVQGLPNNGVVYAVNMPSDMRFRENNFEMSVLMLSKDGTNRFLDFLFSKNRPEAVFVSDLTLRAKPENIDIAFFQKANCVFAVENRSPWLSSLKFVGQKENLGLGKKHLVSADLAHSDSLELLELRFRPFPERKAVLLVFDGTKSHAFDLGEICS